MTELELNMNHGGRLVLPGNFQVHLPALTTADGTHVSGSSQYLPLETMHGYTTKPVSAIIPDLFLGVQLLDTQTMLPMFRVVTHPSLNPWDIKTELDRMPQPQNLSLAKHNFPYAILPLIDAI